MTKFGILLWATFTTCLASPNIHKQMTSDELQSIFHVENVESVPHYELVELQHHGTSHHISKRSINNLQEVNAKESHHVKKDLSKSPYYSELKLSAQQNGGNSISAHNFSDKIKNLDLRYIKEHNVSFSAFGEVLNLTLKPTEGLFKDGPHSLQMWTASPDSNSTQGIEYERIIEDPENEEDHVGEIFQDEDNMAAILMHRQLETGDLLMEGSIGHELVIKPLPQSLSPNKDVVHHIIYKREAEPVNHLSDFAFMEPDRLQRHYREPRSSLRTSEPEMELDPLSSVDESNDGESSSSKRSKRAAPHIIYPEILVIVDYDGYRLHGGDNVQVKRYFVSFWNGVDLRYRLLKGPRIRISIAGIIISRGRDATPYLERNRVGRDAIDSAAALTDMGKYLFRERRLPVYDIAVAITKLDMCRRSYAYGECKRGTAGFAYVGGACVVNKRLEKVNSVAIIEDTGGFSGIIVAAHEVGHLLGAVHDGSPPPSYLGGPGAQKCRWEDGYIMSDLRHTERGFRWSPCTVQSFHHFLNGDTASCLHNAPHEDSALGRALPGTLLSLDAQCRRDRGTYACFKDDRVCAQLFCFDSLTGYCVAYRPAAEGSSCGNGMHCLDGRCLGHHENVIPDYSQRAVNYYSPVYNDDDTEEPTTKSTTTTTTTTTTPLPSLSYENPSNDDNNNNKFQTSTEKTHTRKPFDSIFNGFATTKRPASINPFYYGFSKLSTKSPNAHEHKISAVQSSSTSATTTTTTTTKTTTRTTTTKKPFSYHSQFNKSKSSHSNTPYNSSSLSSRPTAAQTTTTKAPTNKSTTTSSSSSGDGNSDWNQSTTTTTTHRTLLVSGRSSTTRSPFFESYLKKLASTTRSPYNFENFGQFFRASTQKTPPPSYSSNILGDNSNKSPVNITIAG